MKHDYRRPREPPMEVGAGVHHRVPGVALVRRLVELGELQRRRPFAAECAPRQALRALLACRAALIGRHPVVAPLPRRAVRLRRYHGEGSPVYDLKTKREEGQCLLI